MKVYVDLTSPEQHDTSAMPKTLRRVLYGNPGLLRLIDNTGCPNTGCEHKLSIKGESSDVIAWLDLLADEYPDVTPEVLTIKGKINIGITEGKVGNNGYLTIKLRQITRHHRVGNELVIRPWFWTPSWEEPDA